MLERSEKVSILITAIYQAVENKAVKKGGRKIMRIIDITKLENSQLAADVISTGELTFVMFDFKHLAELTVKLEDLKSASGIYLLIGETELYIGQADDLTKRLSQHQKDATKSWVNRVIMFTNKEKVIGKDM